jgi:4-diphosphocytidyl-2-C-methyl-D-erythritol kinase
MTAVTARVPAKVNLQLAVGPVRADGYHDLVTVYHAVSLFDEVTVAPAEHDSIVVTGEGADEVPLDGGNLAARAVAALTDTVGPGLRDSPGIAIRIRKRIPVAAGLAGGSGDAAAALVACNELWRAGLSQHDLCEIAAGLGSDVAFALTGGTAVGTGRGEQVTSALTSGAFHWVLAFATSGLSTAEVYAACDRIRATRAGQPGGAGTGPAGAASAGAARAAGQPDAAIPGLDGPAAPDKALMAALRSGDPVALGQRLSNDLQPAALSLRPGLRRTLAAGDEFSTLGAIVSGSGPTCAYLARDARHAQAVAIGLTGTGVCRSVACVVGPVPGATVIPAVAESA